MQLRLTAKVDGEGTASTNFEIFVKGNKVGIELNKNHRISAIWVECPIVNYSEYAPSMIKGDGTLNRPHKISMPPPPQVDELRAILQYIESLGSFWLGVRHIGWNSAEARWMPDSDEEHRELSVYSIAPTLEYPDISVPFQPEILEEMLIQREALEYLVIPMSFYREGKVDFRSHRYVSAFYNFYFFLEDLYGRGKTKNQAVLEAFLASEQLHYAVKHTYDEIQQPDMKLNRIELSEIMKSLACDYSPEGLIKFLVMVRGELHHFSQHSSRPKGHPLNQMYWRSVAFFAMSVCLHLIEFLASGTPPDNFSRL